MTNHELLDFSELFHQGGGCHRLHGQPASVGLLYPPLAGLLFRRQPHGHREHGLLLLQDDPGKGKGTEYFLKIKNQCSNCAPFQDGQKLSQDEWGGSLNESCHGPGEAHPEFCPHRPHLCNFLENHCLDKKMKLIKISDHMTNLDRLASS